MRLNYQNHVQNHSENSSNLNQNYNADNSSNDEYSSHQEIDSNNNKLNKSFTEDESSSKQKKNSNQIKEKTYYLFVNAIFNDDIKFVDKIIDSSQNKGIVDYPSTTEGLTPIQYAAAYGSIECFKYFMKFKVDKERKLEGLNLIHLSLSRAIFTNEKDNCIKMFNYIYDKLPNEREYKDRLGRTYLHIIFEYDFIHALDTININLDELFIQDNNGDFVINYVYIYNANNCFFKVAKDHEFLSKLYKEIRNRYEKNNIPKEKFLENLFVHQNLYAIAIIIMNSKLFINELSEDFDNLKNFFNAEINNDKDKDNDLYNTENKNIHNLIENINYAMEILNLIKTGGNFSGKFSFPQKIRLHTGIIYNPKCIQHVKLPEEPLKHLMTRISMFENSDRLAILIDTEKNGIVLNDQVLHYAQGISYEEKVNKNLEHTCCENIIFKESQRKSCLNDILKCHDMNYIQKIKDICYSKLNHSSFKKHESQEKTEKGLNISKILSKMDTTNPLYKTYFNTNYQSHFKKIDVDTYVNEYSFENIFNTTGCVLDAVDFVLEDKVKNALVLIRPPGHNAGYYGPVENSCVASTGFCLVNNVTIGVAYAKNKYREKIKKVAIFDFDAHHGNGTEEIIQMLNCKIFEKKFCYDKLCELKTINSKQINWADEDDAKNVLFISTHIYDDENGNGKNNFYPYSGGTESNTDKKSPIYPGGIFNIPLSSKNKNITGTEYRNIIKTKVIPRLYEFKPDIIFLSAGFDSHENEIINQKFMSLNEFDYSFITQQMQFVANKFCEGRLISVLEGGYNIATSITSSFAQSVLAHAKFLSLSLNMFQIFDVKLTGFKRQPQIKDEDNNIDSKNINKESNENIDDDENQEKSKEKEYKEEEKENKECEKEIKENGSNNKEEKENTREEAVKEDNEGVNEQK